MKNTITFGGISAQPGHKGTGWTPVPGTDLALPVTVINGEKEGKTVLITSAIHGCEYPSIEAVFELAEGLDPKEISGQIVIVNPVNVEAFINRRPYIVPADGKNLNRLFPPDPLGSPGDKLAYTLAEEFIKKADFHIDTHGGDIPETQPSYVYYPGISEDKEALAISEEAASYILHAKYMLKSRATNHAYTYSAMVGVPSLELELGECTRWSRQEVDDYIENILNILKFLKVYPGEAVKRPADQEITTITEGVYLDADYSGRWYPLVGRDDRIVKGQKIGYIKDLFGNVLVEYFAEYDAEILMVVATLAIKKGDPIIAYGR
ncbi:MAG: succinylglutamate desuccinylase/aspartoacylase family protein [Eubacterium sp.]|nr:succinylglutamate desuccinylase/aspartoacylase family protein [Eubacterium sp.]